MKKEKIEHLFPLTPAFKINDNGQVQTDLKTQFVNRTTFPTSPVLYSRHGNIPAANQTLYPPPRPELVSRPRLIERLNEGLHRKLTLISAPAGFGKTTLVSSWIDHLAGEHRTKVIEILILQALAVQAGDDTAQTITMLEKALTLAEPSGFIRIFVDEGPPMARLLYEALVRGIAPDYAQRLLAAFPNAEPEQTSPSETKVSPSELVEPLSEREIEVLQLIANGLTNPEIAARLFLSLNTVKDHTRNIYGKLGAAHNRTQAVAQARALGILPSI